MIFYLFNRKEITYDLSGTRLRMDEEITSHKLLDDILTFNEIIYPYIHLDQELKITREIQKMLNVINRSLIFTFNTYLRTAFTKFRPHLPNTVNVLWTQVHRINNIIYFVHRNVVMSYSCRHLSTRECIKSVNCDLLAIIYAIKHFIAAQLSGAVAR